MVSLAALRKRKYRDAGVSADGRARGADGFEKHYSEVFGERWPQLHAALLQPVAHVARINAFVDGSTATAQLPTGCSRLQELEPALVFSPPEEAPLQQAFEPPEPCASGLLPYYIMDPASVHAVLALDAQPGERVADFCAAPGGKSLLIAEALREEGELVANDVSKTRRMRLLRVFKEYLPEAVFERCKVIGRDATQWFRHERDAYDRVLLDAPCSSERHLLEDSKELASWSPRRVKVNAKRQENLLLAALDVVRVGGRIVYSTCALSPAENDGAVARLLKRRPGRARVEPPEPRGGVGERAEHGVHILPDAGGSGPIYYSVLTRLE